MMRQSVYRIISTVRMVLVIVLALMCCASGALARKVTRSPGIVCRGVGLVPSRGHLLSGRDSVSVGPDGAVLVPGRRYDGAVAYPLEGISGGRDVRVYAVPEKDGEYSLAFDVCIPKELLNDRLQVQVYPELVMGTDLVPLPSVYLSGTRFRRAQMKRFRSLGVDAGDLALSEGVMLDSTCVFGKEDVLYRYVRKVPSDGPMQEMKVRLSVSLSDGTKGVAFYPDCDSVVFLPYSVRSFAFPGGSAMRKERTVVSNPSTSYRIEFPAGRGDLQPSYRKNAVELGRLKDDMLIYLNGDRMVLDSVLVVANVSPDGNWSTNYALSMQRGESVAKALSSFLLSYADDYTGVRSRETVVADVLHVGFSGMGKPENWGLLERLVESDEHLSVSQKSRFASQMGVTEPDERERRMQKDNYYQYLKDNLYPQLRMTDVSFVLSRRPARQREFAPVKMSPAYGEAVGRLREGGYADALAVLEPYQDYNTAVAYASAGDYVGALDILLGYEKVPVVSYLIAYCLFRGGAVRAEVDRYLGMASAGDRAFLYRAYVDGLVR